MHFAVENKYYSRNSLRHCRGNDSPRRFLVPTGLLTRAYLELIFETNFFNS